jgi:hypothetical protein
MINEILKTHASAENILAIKTIFLYLATAVEDKGIGSCLSNSL